MILPPVTQDYKPETHNVMLHEIEKSDGQNLKLDQDNFLTTGSICLQDSVGDWFKIVINSNVVATVDTFVNDTGHTNDITITLVPLTGGSGSGAQATVDITTSGEVEFVTITTGGTGYVVDDVLTISASIIGGSDMTCEVATLSSADPTLIITKLAGTQLDANGRPLLASTNPYS